MASVFCDRLTVSVPLSHDAALSDVQREYGVALGATPKGSAWVLPDGGTLYYGRWSNAATLEASGRALSALRAASLYADYLFRLGELPHRVTRLDATLDLPRRSAPFLHELKARAQGGALSLGRKLVQPLHVLPIFTLAAYPGEPLETGTLYLPSQRYGRTRASVDCYDKRQERIMKTGTDPGHWLRIEAHAWRGKGATLADAWDPSSLFWDIASPGVLPAPAGTPAWEPHALGWSAPPREDLLPLPKLRRYLEGSAGAELRRLASFPGAAEFVAHWLRSAGLPAPLSPPLTPLDSEAGGPGGGAPWGASQPV